MLAAQRPPWVKYHSIVGVLPKGSWLAKMSAEGDGVVPRESAHFDGAASEIIVPADHSSVHSHPAAVLEVRRILLEHLAELEGRPVDGSRRPQPTRPTASSRWFNNRRTPGNAGVVICWSTCRSGTH